MTQKNLHIAMLLSNPFRPDTRVLKEANAIAAHGRRVTIICWDRAAELPARETLPTGVQIVRVQNVLSAYGIGLSQLWRLPRFWLAALKILRQLKPDLIHCHDFDTLPAGLWYGKWRRLPVVYDAHEHYADLCKPRLHGRLGRLLYLTIRTAERVGARLASAVITVDETLGDIFRQLNRRVLIIGHYPSQTILGPENPVFTRDRITLLYVGRLSVDRGALVYADLLRCLRERGLPARLCLVGDFTPAADADRFNKRCESFENHVERTGFLPFNQIPNVMQAADVGLAMLQPIPRFEKAVPVKLFEYMAAGLPVLISDFAPNAAVVKAAKYGRLLDPKDVETAADQIEAWWRDPELAQTIGRAGQHAIANRYNWENLAEKIYQLYDSII